MSTNIDILRNLLNELSIINRDVKSISVEIYNFPYKMLNNKEIGNLIHFRNEINKKDIYFIFLLTKNYIYEFIEIQF